MYMENFFPVKYQHEARSRQRRLCSFTIIHRSHNSDLFENISVEIKSIGSSTLETNAMLHKGQPKAFIINIQKSLKNSEIQTVL